jgi:hypothetical protein
MGRQKLIADITPSIRKKTQGPLRRNPGIKLSQTTRGRIARIHKYFFVPFRLRFVQALKIGKISLS